MKLKWWDNKQKIYILTDFGLNIWGMWTVVGAVRRKYFPSHCWQVREEDQCQVIFHLCHILLINPCKFDTLDLEEHENAWIRPLFANVLIVYLLIILFFANHFELLCVALLPTLKPQNIWILETLFHAFWWLLKNSKLQTAPAFLC